MSQCPGRAPAAPGAGSLPCVVEFSCPPRGRGHMISERVFPRFRHRTKRPTGSNRGPRRPFPHSLQTVQRGSARHRPRLGSPSWRGPTCHHTSGPGQLRLRMTQQDRVYSGPCLPHGEADSEQGRRSHGSREQSPSRPPAWRSSTLVHTCDREMPDLFRLAPQREGLPRTAAFC